MLRDVPGVQVRRNVHRACEACVHTTPVYRQFHVHVRVAQIPGLRNPLHTFWLFPIMVADPRHVCEQVSAKGFDVTSGTTQLGPVDRCVGWDVRGRGMTCSRPPRTATVQGAAYQRV